MVIPILMRFYRFVSNSNVAGRIPTKGNVINDIIISKDILLQFYDVIQSDVALQKHVHKNFLVMIHFIS